MSRYIAEPYSSSFNVKRQCWTEQGSGRLGNGSCKYGRYCSRKRNATSAGVFSSWICWNISMMERTWRPGALHHRNIPADPTGKNAGRGGVSLPRAVPAIFAGTIAQPSGTLLRPALPFHVEAGGVRFGDVSAHPLPLDQIPPEHGIPTAGPAGAALQHAAGL